jgi:5-methyltetrahydrofolate--homocysteine methyltransferase
VIELSQLKQSIIDGDDAEAVALTRKALDAGCSPDVLFKEALFTAMDEVGRRMQCHEYFLPEVLLSAQAMQACAALVRPLIVTGSGAKPVGTALVCTVAGDLHDIGKNLVCLMLEGAGFTVIDLGNNCSADKIVAAVREHAPDILCLSAMLTTTMLNMRRVIDALQAAGLRDRVHVMVGGAPVDVKFSREIGADFYSSDAPGGSIHAKEYVTGAAGPRTA